VSEAAVAMLARRREVEWELVDWEGPRGGREAREVLTILRSAIAETSEPAPLALALPRREREQERDSAVAGGGALSLRERVGVRGESAVEAFASAVGALSTSDVAREARSLAGLGEGSTPAGDDFLVGAMYALRWLVPDARADQLCESIAAAAAPRTTRLSAQFLQRAAGGEAIPTWSFFLSALATGEPARIRDYARGVLALGHTSGRAALVGFIATAEALIGDSA
jgi:hypothetical protein